MYQKRRIDTGIKIPIIVITDETMQAVLIENILSFCVVVLSLTSPPSRSFDCITLICPLSTFRSMYFKLSADIVTSIFLLKVKVLCTFDCVFMLVSNHLGLK